jgi:hypothetical protein
MAVTLHDAVRYLGGLGTPYTDDLEMVVKEAAEAFDSAQLLAEPVSKRLRRLAGELRETADQLDVNLARVSKGVSMLARRHNGPPLHDEAIERVQLLAQIDHLKTMLLLVERQVAEARADAVANGDALSEALNKLACQAPYLRHLDHCVTHQFGSSAPCDCGRAEV